MVQGEKAGVTIPAHSDDMGGHDDVGNNHAIQDARGSAPKARATAWYLFAAILLAVIGCFNLIYGIAPSTWPPRVTTSSPTCAPGPDHPSSAAPVARRGWRDGGNQVARWFAVAVLGLNAIDQCSYPAYPFWSLTIIALDVRAVGCAPTVAAERGRLARHVQSERRQSHRGPGMNNQGQPGSGWTVVLRRQLLSWRAARRAATPTSTRSSAVTAAMILTGTTARSQPSSSGSADPIPSRQASQPT